MRDPCGGYGFNMSDRHQERGTTWADRVERELEDRLAPDHVRRYADSDAPTSDPAELVAEQRRETGELRGAPTLPFLSGPMWKGMVGGGIAGAVVGAIVVAPLALISWGGVSLAIRLIWTTVIGVAAGAVVGAHYWGGRAPELGGESIDADNRPSVGSSLADEDRGRRSA